MDYSTLTRFEKRAILQILDEQTRIGKWHRLMPIGDTQYMNLFEKKRYLTELCNACLKQGVKVSDLV